MKMSLPAPFITLCSSSFSSFHTSSLPTSYSSSSFFYFYLPLTFFCSFPLPTPYPPTLPPFSSSSHAALYVPKKVTIYRVILDGKVNILRGDNMSQSRVVHRYSDWLRAGRSGNQIPVGARFFANVQTGPGTHPASCTMGAGSFLGVKRPGRGADHPSLLAPRSRMSGAIRLLPLWALGGLLQGDLYLYLFYINHCEKGKGFL
jgi:hypothetical protein